MSDLAACIGLRWRTSGTIAGKHEGNFVPWS
jgi:hypothetical protein